MEFAIGAGVLASVFIGTFQFGYTCYQYNALVNAVNAGARYASVRPYDSTTTTPSTAYSTAVKNMVVYGSPSGGTTPVLRNLSTSNVPDPVITFSNSVPATVKVSISGYTVDAVFTQTTFNKPVVTYPYVGIYSPAP